jgi:hypothetical protein
MIFEVIFIASSFWILFLGGAAKLENSFMGFFSFGRYGDKESFIKGLVWVSLAVYVFKKFYT